MCDDQSPSDLELVATLINGAPAARLVRAHELLCRAGGLWALRQWSRRRLRSAGISARAADRLTAAFSLGPRALAPPTLPAAVCTPEDAFALFAPRLAGALRERFVVAALDVKNRPRHLATVAEGTAELCFVQPRDVMRAGLVEGGVALIVAHNHPSGDPTPSAEDLALTARLQAAGELVGLALLDHLIIADARPDAGAAAYRSLAREGLFVPRPCARALSARRAGRRGLNPPPAHHDDAAAEHQGGGTP